VKGSGVYLVQCPFLPWTITSNDLSVYSSTFSVVAILARTIYEVILALYLHLLRLHSFVPLHSTFSRQLVDDKASEFLGALFDWVVSKEGGVAEVGNLEQEEQRHGHGGRAHSSYLERQRTNLRHAFLRIALTIRDDRENGELKRNICCAMRLGSRKHRTGSTTGFESSAVLSGRE
jgi:hypothetical protein